MKFIPGKDRNQTEFFCLEQAIAHDNEVRLTDLFVASLKLSDHDFDMYFTENGRPVYHPGDLLRLFIYVTSTAYARNVDIEPQNFAFLCV